MTELSVRGFLSSLVRRLEAVGIEEAQLKAEWAVSRALGCRRLELPLNARTALLPATLQQCEAYARRLAEGEPLQYVLGDVEFMGLTLKTDRRALIPRPETETLVDTVLNWRPLWTRSHPPGVMDVGTGSGCIVLALAARQPAVRWLARDISPEALTLARENATALGLSALVKFSEGDLLEGVPAGSLDAVVANPPYVPTAQWRSLDRSIRNFEPRVALDGGGDGLEVIRRLILQAFTSLTDGGILFLEVGEDQAVAVKSLLQDAGFARAETRQDLAGRERVMVGTKS